MGNGASGATIRSQNAVGRELDPGLERLVAEASPGAGRSRSPRRRPRPGSMSDAESVKIATRLKQSSSAVRDDVAGMIRAGSSPSRSEPLRSTRWSARSGSSCSAPSRSASAPGLTGAMLGLYLADLPDARRTAGRRHRRRHVRRRRSTCPSWSCRRSSASCPTGWATTGSCSMARSSAASRCHHRADDVELPVLGGTRLLEGASTAASVPSILGFIALATAGNELLRGKAAARFEGATLAGLGVGFIVAPKLFEAIGPNAFFLNAVVYGDLVPHLLARRQGSGRRGARPSRRRMSGSPATSRSSARRTSCSSRRPGSRSTPASGCGSASRCSSSRRPTRRSPTRP